VVLLAELLRRHGRSSNSDGLSSMSIAHCHTPLAAIALLTHRRTGDLADDNRRVLDNICHKLSVRTDDAIRNRKIIRERQNASAPLAKICVNGGILDRVPSPNQSQTRGAAGPQEILARRRATRNHPRPSNRTIFTPTKRGWQPWAVVPILSIDT
jgi:hypothetical protein